MRSAPAATNRLPALPNWGVDLVDHLCPACGATSRLPLTNLADGPLGDWSCESCDAIFRIQVFMEQLDLPAAPPAAVQDAKAKTNVAQEEDRLLTLYGEELHLRSRLEDLREEVARLEQARAK